MSLDLTTYVTLVESELSRLILDQKNIPAELSSAMDYALMAGGKRIRPALVLTTNRILGGNDQSALMTACAIEMIHTYSLIHDDLPCMDDDELRRGKPTLHVKYSEATAVLAGDALQSLAFELLSTDSEISTDIRLGLIQSIAKAIGPAGMVAGQVHDMAGENQCLSPVQLNEMHNRKTGDLIAASVMAGARIAGAPEVEQSLLAKFGYALGLAFQVRDDLLDVLSTTEQLGKPQGSDERQAKTTFVSLFGIDGARSRLKALHTESKEALQPFGAKAAPLIELADFVVDRIH